MAIPNLLSILQDYDAKLTNTIKRTPTQSCYAVFKQGSYHTTTMEKVEISLSLTYILGHDELTHSSKETCEASNSPTLKLGNVLNAVLRKTTKEKKKKDLK